MLCGKWRRFQNHSLNITLSISNNQLHVSAICNHLEAEHNHKQENLSYNAIKIKNIRTRSCPYVADCWLIDKVVFRQWFFNLLRFHMCMNTQGSSGSWRGSWWIFRKLEGVVMDLQEVGGGCGDWMELAQDRDRWRALVGTVRDFAVP